ncbi:MAG TPA: class I SAM-dependent methyltransferase [Marinagarivorans sp.]
MRKGGLNVADVHGLVEAKGVKGFLPAREAEALFIKAREQAPLGPLLEVGSYCGRSAVYLGAAAAPFDQVVFTVDHHSGSEEHQRGEAYFEAEHWDPVLRRVDTLSSLRRNLYLCAMEDVVTPIVARSEALAKVWATPLAMVFIDGGHSEAQAKADCLLWARHLMPNGVMAIHDIFERPEDGGQAPYRAMQAVMADYDLTLLDRTDSLVFLTFRQ